MQMMVQPMRDELTRVGFKELRTPEEVVEALEGEGKKGTTLIVVNSVCGCAAGLARPAVAKALNHAENRIICTRFSPDRTGKPPPKPGNILKENLPPHPPLR